ncbi:MAG: PEGA domain-containing protein [Byssovorax sp.]
MADGAAHSPVFVLYMARCKRDAGDLVAARDLFEGVVREPVPDGAPEQWHKAHDDASKELSALDTRIPGVILSIRNAPPEGAAVTLDGKPLPVTALRAPIRLNPGEHAFAVSAPGRRNAAEKVKLTEGDELRKIELTLAPLAPSAPATTPPIAPPPPVAPPARGPLWPSFVAFGVGAAGIAAGAITGVIAKGRADEVKANCIDGHCLRSDADKASSATTLASASTATFIVGGAAAAAGVALVLLRPGGSSSASAALSPGPGALMIHGSF